MILVNALEEHGYTFRQHLEEEGWTARKLTVIDLDAEQREALEEKGTDGLRTLLNAQETWAFPSLEITSALPRITHSAITEGDQTKATVVAADPQLNMARAFIREVADRFGPTLPLIRDEEATLDLLQSGHIILFGGSHQSQLAMALAMRYQTCFIDAAVPGSDGWAVTTHLGLEAVNHNVIQIASSDATETDALQYLLEHLEGSGDELAFPNLHHIVMGQEMRAHFQAWEEFALGYVTKEERSPHLLEDLHQLAELIGKGLDSGGPDVNRYNAAPVDTAVSCARYYQLSGDPRALQLFRELLFQLADYYLKTPEGASYIADLDFRIGSLVLYYSRLEHDAVFSDSDRSILASLLFSCVHSCYEYAMKIWPIEPNGPTRHNHETFPARSLMFAADHFDRYEVPLTDLWWAYTNDVFSGGIWNRFKQKENAHHYEQTAFEHAASYSAFTGRGLSLFGPDCLRLAAMKQVIATDNFLRPVDYGDTSIRMTNGDTDILPMLASSSMDDPTLKWYASESFAQQHHYLPSPIHGIPGIRTSPGGAIPDSGTWERMPLDKSFLSDFSPGFPDTYAFDKLAFRTGWGDQDHYLLFEGVGNKTISHSHNDLNGIVRLNHLGRHWIVSNGYGRLAGLTNVNKSFNTRVRGPEDHNVLVLKKENEILEDLPVCNALLQLTQSEDCALATGAVLGYAGANWYRTLLLLPDRFLLVLDRLHLVNPEFDSAHIEWNGLGSLQATPSGHLLEQQGHFMHISSPSGWTPIEGIADRSADWQRVLESGSYPFASFPLAKLTFNIPEIAAGQTHHFATLLAAGTSRNPIYEISQPTSGTLRIDSAGDKFPLLDLADQDVSVKSASAQLEFRYSETPEIPDALKPYGAN
jgi:hypothetical protein